MKASGVPEGAALSASVMGSLNPNKHTGELRASTDGCSRASKGYWISGSPSLAPAAPFDRYLTWEQLQQPPFVLVLLRRLVRRTES